MTDGARIEPDYRIMTPKERATALAQWNGYVYVWRETLTKLERQACELREKREPLTDDLAKSMADARGFLRKAERQIARLRESAK